MKHVLGLNLTEGCPTRRRWDPIFESARILDCKLLAYPNRGGVWTLTIPIELKPEFTARRLSYPATQSFRTEYLKFAEES